MHTYTRRREGDTARLYLTRSMPSKKRQISKSAQASIDAHGSEADKGKIWCWERIAQFRDKLAVEVYEGALGASEVFT